MLEDGQAFKFDYTEKLYNEILEKIVKSECTKDLALDMVSIIMRERGELIKDVTATPNKGDASYDEKRRSEEDGWDDFDYPRDSIIGEE